MDLSIIIPFYNKAEEQLYRCIESIKKLESNRTCNKKDNDAWFEVILVDDGSTDGADVYGKNCAETYGIRYIRQTHGGVSSARNTGIDTAKGKYIMFVDADDQLVAEEFDYSSLQGDGDVLAYNFIFCKGKRRKIKSALPEDMIGKADYKKLQLAVLVNNVTWEGIPGKIYKKEFLKKNGLCFGNDIITGEDLDFGIRVLGCMPTIIHIPNALYQYEYKTRTGIERWRKNPDAMITSGKICYENRLSAISSLDISDKQKLVNKLCKNRISAIYQQAVNLSCAGQLTGARKKIIVEYMKNFESYITYMPPKILKKYRIIINENWNKIKAYAMIWTLYLKCRGIY